MFSRTLKHRYERIDLRSFRAPNSTSVLSFLRAVLLSPPVFIVVVTGLGYLFTVWIFAEKLFWREPHSSFFREEHAYDFIYSQQRLDDGAKFLDKVAKDADFSPTHANGPLLCASIGTIKRQTDYLNGTIATMLQTLTPEERSLMEVRLTFVSVHPTEHPNWESDWTRLVDFHGGYNVTDAEMEQLRIWQADMKWIQWKGIWDYAYLLQDCYLRSTAPYIAVFEDDIVFAEGWLSKMIKALADLREMGMEWLYVRLFYTEQFHVFWGAKDYFHSNRHVAWALGAAVSAFCLFLLRGCSRTVQRGLSNWTLLALACITVPAVINLWLMVPKHYLIPPNGLTRMEGACCTQALIFPRAQVMDVVEYLLERERGQTDLMIEKYAHEMGISRWAVEPQQVQHVGVKSSRGVNGKRTWSHWFETYNKEALRKEHLKTAKTGVMWRAQEDGFDALDSL